MKNLLVILLLSNFLSTASAQIDPEEGCNLTTIQIASGSEENITMRHAGFFIFLPSQGQETLWEISTTAHQSTIATSTEEHFIFDLPTHDISIADSVVVDLSITNSNGDVCAIRDTLVWSLVGIVNVDPPVELFNWNNLDSLGNPGVYNPSNTNTSSPLDSEISAYPDPTNGALHIDFGSLAIAPDLIKVYDYQGRVVDQQPSSEVRNGSTELTLVESGFYILRIHIGREVITKRIMVE